MAAIMNHMVYECKECGEPIASLCSYVDKCLYLMLCLMMV